MIRALIVDDEPLVRRGLERFLADESDIRVVGSCADGREAVRAIRREAPDLVFLDIQMPGGDGFEVLDSIPTDERPGVVFVTAWDRYAVRAFEVRAIDYLLKPFDRPRFRRTVQHVREHLEQMRSDEALKRPQDLLEELKSRKGDEAVRFMVRSAGRVRFVDADRVAWIEAAGNYVYLHTGTERLLMRGRLKELAEQLPEGAFARVHRSSIVRLNAVEETVDLARGRIRRTISQRTVQFPSWRPVTYIYERETLGIVLPGGVRPGFRSQLRDFRDRLPYGPERVLFTAIQATDLAADPPALLQGVLHDRVHFTEGGDTIRIWLNSHTGLPTAVDIVRTEGGAFDVIWGRTTSRTLYSLWTMEPGGIRYPRQWDMEIDGTPRESLTITSLETAPALEEADLHLDDATIRAFSEMPSFAFDEVVLGTAFGGLPLDPIEPAGGITLYPGSWNTTIVRQDDGVVVLEADYRDIPDRLTRSPRSLHFTPVEGPVPVGSGRNRMVLYPVWGEAGERMVMAYFPEHRLLYGSDLLQRLPDGRFWMTQYVWELVQAVRREGLDVERVYAMHLTPIPWSDVLAALESPPVGADVSP